MQSITSRCSTAVIRAGLVVSLVVAGIALTPRTASAEVLLCDGHGFCFEAPDGCGSYPLHGDWMCFLIGTAMARDPNTYLMRDGRGGASIVIAGRTSAIIFPSDASAAKLENLVRERKGGIDKQATEAFQKAFYAAARSGDRTVSDERLETLSKGLQLPITKEKPKR